MRYRIGIDPGDRYIGLAIAAVDDKDIAYPVHLAVIDLRESSQQTDLRKLVAQRAQHRRARRTRKSLKARLADINKVLMREKVPAQEAEAVAALCRRRGWKPDKGEADSKPEEEKEGAIRRSREEVLAALKELISRSAPSLSHKGLTELLAILNAPGHGHGLDNRRVGTCGFPSCTRKRARGVDYPALWLGAAVLNHLLPPERKEARQCFLRCLQAEYGDISADDYSRFRCQSQIKREKAYEAVRNAWGKTKKRFSLPEKVVENLERILRDGRRRIREAENTGGTRLHFCPEHWHERVRSLASGEVPPQGKSTSPGHSVVWEAVAAKLGSYIQGEVLPRLPKDAEIEEVAVERAAFDLIHLGSGRPSLNIIQEARWLGPYGQLRRLVKEDADEKRLLAAETQDLCALCGRLLGDDIDRAHILPREQVGGYPYLAVVAAHTRCNTQMGSRLARIAPEAVEAMKEVRSQLLRRQQFVHAWFDAKLGILNSLAADWGEKGPPPVESYMRRTFASREATMQGSDRLGEVVVRAIQEANRGNPGLRKRSASEVSGARLAAVSQRGEVEPWFLKSLEKQQGDVVNHAMDAFITAALPPAEFVGQRGDKRFYSVSPERLIQRLQILRKQEDWEEACRQVWHPQPENLLDKKTESFPALSVMSLTMRRVWRQAYVQDTRQRQEDTKRGAYRQPAQEWLDVLQKKKDLNKIKAHLENLQFKPLQDAALQAFEESASNSKDLKGVKEAVRDAVVRFLKESTLAGLEGAKPGPTEGHPVRKARIESLKKWAEEEETEKPVPPWVSVTLRADRMVGAKTRKFPVYQGSQNLESWAQALWVLALDKWGSTLFQVEPDGGITYVAGCRAKIDSRPLQEALPKPGKNRPIPFLPPSVSAWRWAVAQALQEAGFSRAWIVSRGSVLVTGDGRRLILEKRKSLKQKALTSVTRVARGAWRLL